MWYVRPAKANTRSLIRAMLVAEYFMSDKLLTEHHYEFLSFKGGCTGSSESTCVKMPHCSKASVTAHITNLIKISLYLYNYRIYHVMLGLYMIQKRFSYFSY